MKLGRYHVYVNVKRQLASGEVVEERKRTTVTIADVVAGMLAVELMTDPFAPNAHSAVREWLQAELDGPLRNVEWRLSRQLSLRALRAIVRPEVTSQYQEYQARALQSKPDSRDCSTP